MKKLLYAFVLASVLVLAGSAVLAGLDEPNTGGTVPDGEYALWLPVVGYEVPSVCITTDIYMKYISSKMDPAGLIFYFGNMHSNDPASNEAFYSIWNSETGVNGSVLIATDPEFQNVVITTQKKDLSPYSFFPGFQLYPYRMGSLVGGQVYYTRFEYTCLGHLVRTPVYVFTWEPWRFEDN
ncbi:MAG: hypothetical protein KF753_18290 [Caldilineaceae bacterium]|nr:hypothetical protein [Caldilineaceae bacterium]